MKVLRYIAVLMVCCLAIQAYAQTKAQKKAAQQTAVKAMIDGQRFDFVAQYATAQAGARRYLTSTYDLKVRPDSLIAYLPYYGQAYFDVPYNPTDGGIKFTSTNFTYKAKQRAKGGWDIVIEPADAKYYRRLDLYVSPDGNASVYFTIINKSFITFDGYIEAPEKRR